MPRKNNITPHTPYRRADQPAGKRRFTTKRQAEDVANEQMLLRPDLQLYVYKDLDGGWYLTRKNKPGQ